MSRAGAEGNPRREMPWGGCPWIAPSPSKERDAGQIVWCGFPAAPAGGEGPPAHLWRGPPGKAASAGEGAPAREPATGRFTEKPDPEAGMERSLCDHGEARGAFAVTAKVGKAGGAELCCDTGEGWSAELCCGTGEA